MTWRKFVRSSWQGDGDSREPGRRSMHRIRQKSPEGTAGQSLSGARGTGVVGQGRRGGDPGVRDIAYGDDSEGIVGRVLRYPLPLKVLDCGQDVGGERGEYGMDLRCFYRECGRGGQP